MGLITIQCMSEVINDWYLAHIEWDRLLDQWIDNLSKTGWAQQLQKSESLGKICISWNYKSMTCPSNKDTNDDTAASALKLRIMRAFCDSGKASLDGPWKHIHQASGKTRVLSRSHSNKLNCHKRKGWVCVLLKTHLMSACAGQICERVGIPDSGPGASAPT